MDVRIQIEKLLLYGLQHELLAQEDVVFVRNELFALLQIDEPIEDSTRITDQIPAQATPILEPILDVAAEKGILAENHTTARDLLDAKIMGLLMPRPSEVIRQFTHRLESHGPVQALTYFYELSKASNYIRMDRIAHNEYWQAETEGGKLEITINLSKPEKDPREIAALKEAPQQHYPRCLLCVENVGYAGRLNHPARQNHRVLPLTLNNERWYFQYSPYVYYREHSIILHEQHVPMEINQHTFQRLLDFIEQFPHYFIGSNADLPIVGGSILNHDHFQGGRHTFPMQKAPIKRRYSHPDFPQVQVGIVRWPMSVVRLTSKRSDSLVELAGQLLEAWKEYSDPDIELIASQEASDGIRTVHNTVTPIAWRTDSAEFVLDLVFRNNRTSKAHPEGIFHPHREHHHIKKENIGLIEVMGLAVLPGRLKAELDELTALFQSEKFDEAFAQIQQEDKHPLHKHKEWIMVLKESPVKTMNDDQTLQWLRQQVGLKFYEVLTHAGIFKDDARGQAAFNTWMYFAGFRLAE